jgi:hypothetical protein
MSTKAPRTIYRNRHTLLLLLRTSPARIFSTTSLKAKSGLAKARSTLRREAGDLSSFRTRKLARGIIDQQESYPASIWGSNSWTQMQMVKMGVPSSSRWDVIEFMFFGQIHQESPKSRAEWWQERYGKFSPREAHRAGPVDAVRTSCFDIPTTGVGLHY